MEAPIGLVMPEFSAFVLKKKNRNLTPLRRGPAPTKKKKSYPGSELSPSQNSENLAYTISEEYLIGTGDEGKVYRVDHSEKGLVAVKVLICESVQCVASKFREFFYGSQLQHEGLVKYYDFSFVSNELYFEMELCGISLRQVMTQYRILSEEYEKLFIELLLAMEYLHAQDIVHLDVKPSNILVSGNGRDMSCKLADFGLMVKTEEWVEDGGAGLYMAPECLNGTSSSTSLDVYSLGVVMMEVILDVELRSWNKNLDIIPWEEFDDDYRSVINAMLLREPHLRPSCLELLNTVPCFEQVAETCGKVIPRSPSVSYPEILPYKEDNIPEFQSVPRSVSMPIFDRRTSFPRPSPRKKKFTTRVSSLDSPRKALFSD